MVVDLLLAYGLLWVRTELKATGVANVHACNHDPIELVARALGIQATSKSHRSLMGNCKLYTRLSSTWVVKPA